MTNSFKIQTCELKGKHTENMVMAKHLSSLFLAYRIITFLNFKFTSEELLYNVYIKLYMFIK